MAEWILTGMLLGSIVTSTHSGQEACEGRKAMLAKERNVTALECRQVSQFTTLSSGSAIGSSRPYTCDSSGTCKVQ